MREWIRQFRAGFRVCLEGGLLRDAHVIGEATLRFAIARDGHVEAADYEQSQIADERLSECMLGLVKNAQFSGAASKLTQVRCVLAIGALPGDGNVPPLEIALSSTPPSAPSFPHAARIRMGTTRIWGRLAPELIQRAMRMLYAGFRVCYENGLRR